MVLNAQRRAESFYAAHGYVRRGRDVPGGRDRARADAEGARWLSRSRSPRSASTSSPACGRSSPPRGRTGPSTSAGCPRESNEDARAENCPFCEGREDRTPPETWADRPGGGDAGHARLAGPRGPQPLPGAGADLGGRRAAAPQGGAETEEGFAAAGDPLRATSRGREPDLFRASSATGFHEVIVNSPRHHTSLGQLDDARARRGGGGLARADARLRREGGLRAADRQRGPGGRRLARAQPRPALRARLRAGAGREGARALRLLQPAHHGRRPARARSPRRRSAAGSGWWRSTTMPC